MKPGENKFVSVAPNQVTPSRKVRKWYFGWLRESRG